MKSIVTPTPLPLPKLISFTFSRQKLSLFNSHTMSSKTLIDFFPISNPNKRLKTTAISAINTAVSGGDDGGDLGGASCDETGLTHEQRTRMELKKSIALSKNNLRICCDKINNSKAAEGGNSYVKLEELLVDESWLKSLSGEFQKPYATTLCKFVETEICSGKVPIYPPQHLIFNALNSTPFDKVKVVILGQDPYHGPGQAMGLSFSVPEGIKIPSSLVNIFKELKQDLGCSIPSHGNLEKWAVQGVLLLNTVLTVRNQQANSHAKKGWEQFTDAVIQTVSEKKNGIVFILWGNSAQAKSRLINETKHHILKSAHPSGLSANRGFFGCRYKLKIMDSGESESVRLQYRSLQKLSASQTNEDRCASKPIQSSS